ncbi:hypothetical protein FHS18_001685 [Paenibacillus phyllosphaerae]|uniref:Uncharacterized protein n=1 Tax=Paenibacillus phyllosphaerae TaxID=274593 RepID=A0A7W5AW09_9BACL|nr:hypothetical protein [Paenibacillus phyllosphaerae]MBB3109622.1 hypothetical protein [Paenibacillus phyllosphaerae]
METLVRAERLFAQFEQRQTKQHMRSAVKEWLLASRSVIDIVIDALEEEQNPPAARKINIAGDERSADRTERSGTIW